MNFNSNQFNSLEILISLIKIPHPSTVKKKKYLIQTHVFCTKIYRRMKECMCKCMYIFYIYTSALCLLLCTPFIAVEEFYRRSVDLEHRLLRCLIAMICALPLPRFPYLFCCLLSDYVFWQVNQSVVK
jgi:hypothetical protein